MCNEFKPGVVVQITGAGLPLRGCVGIVTDAEDDQHRVIFCIPGPGPKIPGAGPLGWLYQRLPVESLTRIGQALIEFPSGLDCFEDEP